MTTADSLPHRTPGAFRVPILGAIAREWAEGDPEFPLYFILALVSAWGCAVLIWGLPALYLPAVGLAPLMLLGLVALTRG